MLNRDILAAANDWITVDIEGMRQLPPGAQRNWQEARLGASVTVEGCHHSGDGSVGGQT